MKRGVVIRGGMNIGGIKRTWNRSKMHSENLR